MFDKFGIEYTVTVASAHRTPKRVVEIIKEAHDGVEVFIAIAGLVAHLSRLVASHTTKPVIGVPVNAVILAARIMAVEDQELAEKIELDDVRINEQKNTDIQD